MRDLPLDGMLLFELLRTIVSAAAIAGSWLHLRRAMQARLAGMSPWMLALDLAPVVLMWLWLTLMFARPLLSSCILCAMAFGLGRGNRAKRKASGEPLVFTDRLLGAIVFHPSLYAEFVTPGRLVVWSSVTLLGLAVFGSIEPPLWDAAWPAFVGSLAILAGWRLRPSGASFLRLVHAPSPGQCSFEPDQDAAAIGPLAGIMVHAAIAAAERTGRRSPCAPCLSDALPFVVPQNGPLVLLQLESFFDARRLGPVVPRGLLPNFDRCVAGSVQHGRLRVPAHGANTVRTEFGVLTGLSPGRLGLDRFNPYADFARVPVDSIAWRLRAAGYRTICIHPFNGRFYNRANIMPNLGFDSFLDISSFPPGPRDGPYVSDSEVVGKIRAVLEACGPRTFVFAITMGNHSPWRRPVMASPPDYPQGGAFAGFLEGLARTDEALGKMARIMEDNWETGLLAAFGDHQPSLPRLYGHLGHVDRATEYVIWQGGHGPGLRRDLPAHALPGMMLQEMSLAIPDRRMGLAAD